MVSLIYEATLVIVKHHRTEGRKILQIQDFTYGFIVKSLIAVLEPNELCDLGTSRSVIKKTGVGCFSADYSVTDSAASPNNPWRVAWRCGTDPQTVHL